MGDGTKENPYTREDVLRLIKERGKAEGLDLSGREFKEGINLRKLNLAGIILNKAALWGAHLERAKLDGAQLRETDLARAHLEESRLWEANLENAELWNAHLERSILWGVDFKGARLNGAHLEGAILRLAKFSVDTELANIDWGNYILGEEKLGDFRLASETYRRLKVWHANLGMYDIAAKFFYREWETKRKGTKWLPNPLPRILYTLYWLLCGYGEIPWRVFASAAVVVLGLAFIYFAIGTLTPNTFLNSLYYSAVSFIALGYGQWAPQPAGWVKGLGVFEAFIGVFMMALFLVTFTRKMTR